MTSQKGPIPAQSPAATLGDVLAALGTQQDLSETRRRDLRSAVNRVAALLGDAPERIPLVMPSISAKLAKLSPAAAGVSTKTFHNLRSDFLAAVKASGLHSAKRRARAPLSPPWQALLQELSTRRAHLGLSRFARYASETRHCAARGRRRHDRGFHRHGPRRDAASQAERPAPQGRPDLERGRGTLHACPAVRAGSFLQTPPATRGLVDALRFLPGRCRALSRVVCRDRHVRDRCPAARHGAANGSAAS